MNYPYQNNQYLQNLLLQQTQPQTQEVVKVSGKNGVDALQMPPNSSGLFLDITAPIVWLVQTDGAGYKTSTAYDITPHESEETTQYKTLEERISKLEETINAKSNAKPATRKSESE
jgi:hypothetical protein